MVSAELVVYVVLRAFARSESYTEESFVFCTQDGEKNMGDNLVERTRKVDVTPILLKYRHAFSDSD